MQKKFSIIIPVYNRPEEVEELLDSLTMQSMKDDMQVIVVEDGSSVTCDKQIAMYKPQLDLIYVVQRNQGPGGARNTGATRAVGEYLIFLDSDCVLPSDYLKHVSDHLEVQPLACFGGPDRAHRFFSSVQKSISYSMTSILTTGGIRGGSGKKMDKFYPRSFNMGVRKDVFEEVGGFSNMRYGEDIDFSMTVMEHGFEVGLIPETFVYHKRRSTFWTFYKQTFSSGTARIAIADRHKGAIKLVHLMPMFFVLGLPMSLVLGKFVSAWFYNIYPLYSFLIFLHSLLVTRLPHVALLSIIAAFIQLGGYGLGFMTAVWMKLCKKDKKYVAFRQTLYK